MKLLTLLPVVAAASLLSGCNGFLLDAVWRSERYVLIAVDTRKQMDLAFDAGSGVGVGLVGPTVFAIGADDKYIVLKQHPCKDPCSSDIDRSVTNYFVVTRTRSPELEDRQKGVQGPLTENE